VDNSGKSIAGILNVKDADTPPKVDAPAIIPPTASRPVTTAAVTHDRPTLPAHHHEPPHVRAKPADGATEDAILHSEIGDDLGEFHLASHNALLEFPPFEPGHPARFEGIIVPTVRPDYLYAVGDLARQVNTPLVVLCGEGQKSKADLLLSEILPPGDVHVLEVNPNREHGWLQSSSERYPFSRNEQFKVVDIAGKRNLGLILARMAGWEKIIFLDDDIGALNPSMLERAARLTERYRAVGFQAPDFPDNSVVGHAYRLIGGPQHVFVGAGALAVKLPEHDAFYPSIYNEDWLYLHDAVADRSLAVSDSIWQRPYDPFTDPSRAVKEEFGDLIAEGLFRLLHVGSPRTAYTEVYWQQAIKWRTAFIDGIAERLSHDRGNSPQVAAARTAVNAAGQRLARITPQDCLSFVTGWRTDQEIWKRRFDRLPVASTVEEATGLQSPIWDRVRRLFGDTELAAANGDPVTNGASIVEFVEPVESPGFILDLSPVIGRYAADLGRLVHRDRQHHSVTHLMGETSGKQVLLVWACHGPDEDADTAASYLSQYLQTKKNT
jgi:glycosyltransferase involved in cell wall biosynthesis